MRRVRLPSPHDRRRQRPPIRLRSRPKATRPPSGRFDQIGRRRQHPRLAQPAPEPRMGATTPGTEAITPGVRATTPEPTQIAPTRAPIAGQARPDPGENIDRPAPDGPISRTGPPRFRGRSLGAAQAGDARRTRDAPRPIPDPRSMRRLDPVAAARPIEATRLTSHPAAPAPESQRACPRRTLRRPGSRSAKRDCISAPSKFA